MALGIGAENTSLFATAGIGQNLQDAVRIMERSWHEFRRFTAGIAKHDALVTRAFVLVAGGIDTLGNIGRLGMEQNLDIRIFPMEAGLFIADILDRHTGRMGQKIMGQAFGSTRFTGDHHPIGGGQCFTGNADITGVPAFVKTGTEKGIDYFIRNPVTDLVRMTFGNRFTGE